MSVYTRVDEADLTAFLAEYNVGELIDFTGITAGIENTNYFVTTTGGRFVLTLFEQLAAEELPYFLDLMAFLAEHEVPSAHPIADNAGNYLRTLKGKPAALVQRLNGYTVDHPDPAQCAALGSMLGRLHAVGHEFTEHRDNDRGPHWWRVTADKLGDRLSVDDRAMLDAELAFQGNFRDNTLPRGVIHADLFRDNALFLDEELTGIIDFYYACNDVLLYDLAVTVNDWCSTASGALDPARSEAMLGAYCAQRPVSDDEITAWPVMLRAAALRFWLSRLHDKHFPKEGEITHIKDPEVFRHILEHRVEHMDENRAALQAAMTAS
ncbi:MAG: homoserine kinase [Granulosicoccaceae bacterium]|jgi:homoserine kinase type II